MKRTFALILVVLAAAALFGGLVYALLVAAHVSESGATTVYGLTPRRLWATTTVVLALLGVVIGGLASDCFGSTLRGNHIVTTRRGPPHPRHRRRSSS